MPVAYLRSLTAPHRSNSSNRRLGCTLAFVAGATNAGGFLAVGQYTSHMSGLVSSVADNLVLGQFAFVLSAVGAVGAFLLGAATSAILINWGRHRNTTSLYATPLLLEAALLLVFGFVGSNLSHRQLLYVPLTVALLCYVMGLQNAMITKISKAEIRTTHVTGLITDLGIELGKAMYLNRGVMRHESRYVQANRSRLLLLSSLLGMFILGGIAGAVGFSNIGFLTTVPLAAFLLALAFIPVAEDITAARRRYGRTNDL
ncbi:putative transmembrane protein [Candidatus Burkholderia verschuerenii]|uniref:Putative transmembrane protein n=1 Tax=Candidatus Burkholderia verschuerenii TaxID=242163 RepID=A0A0L0LYI8_9BURK|nr:YoaK family protein [Candidatus Burkholderia verschuerenii]KND55502.1 putative transmembrane protein [Candidatus Burkholderia verschuerenii]